MHDNHETLAIGWCDNGTTDGKFTEGLVYTMLNAPAIGVSIQRAIRIQGNQIARQRQALLDLWSDQVGTDWLLWVDSDIALTADVLKKLWDTADPRDKPVVSGTYFVFKLGEGPLTMPMPALFDDVGSGLAFRHPLPHDEVIRVDSAGFGLLLMHRSIVPAMRGKYPDQSLFAQVERPGRDYVGEDIQFFRRMKAAGIPLFAHTGALVQHVKRFDLDVQYYRMYWTLAQAAADSR